MYVSFFVMVVFVVGGEWRRLARGGSGVPCVELGPVMCVTRREKSVWRIGPACRWCSRSLCGDLELVGFFFLLSGSRRVVVVVMGSRGSLFLRFSRTKKLVALLSGSHATIGIVVSSFFQVRYQGRIELFDTLVQIINC